MNALLLNASAFIYIAIMPVRALGLNYTVKEFTTNKAANSPIIVIIP